MPSRNSLYDNGLVWFRRDLRFADHAALYHALKSCRRVWCAFIFDREILDVLLERGLKADRRVEFIRASLLELDAELRRHGGGLIVRHGFAQTVIPELARQLDVDAVYANHDYEPQAKARDAAVEAALKQDGRRLFTFKDQVIFEKDELLTGSGKPYSVFTPYKNTWLKMLTPFHVKPYPVERYATQLAPIPAELERPMPELEAMGFAATNLVDLNIPVGISGASQRLDAFRERIDRYHETRDFPAVKGPSYLSVHLRFGTVSIRALARAALERTAAQSSRGAEVWLSELIWRDFYFQVLHHHPQVAASEGHRAFKPEYDAIQWETGIEADALFQAWCEGRTGYPLVDAAMAQINQTGTMHNRLRMVVASFLVKDLGIDWRRGEQYFADHLNDFDLAANNGGWQWAASSGCDAQPWFRIFNPVTQSEKFDPEGKFIKRYLPQLQGLSAKEIHAPWLTRLPSGYPAPVVEHELARKRTLERYAVVKRNQ